LGFVFVDALTSEDSHSHMGSCQVASFIHLWLSNHMWDSWIILTNWRTAVNLYSVFIYHNLWQTVSDRSVEIW